MDGKISPQSVTEDSGIGSSSPDDLSTRKRPLRTESSEGPAAKKRCLKKKVRKDKKQKPRKKSSAKEKKKKEKKKKTTKKKKLANKPTKKPTEKQTKEPTKKLTKKPIKKPMKKPKGEENPYREEKIDVYEKGIKIRIVYCCLWGNCQKQFRSVNYRYDHVMQVHMKKIEELNCEDGDVCCMWGKCSQALYRGDWAKKVEWLKTHYLSRHDKTAKPFKCMIEGCTFRAPKPKRLDDHVQNKHLKKVNKRKKPVKVETWYKWKRQWRYTSQVDVSCIAWNMEHDEKLRERLCIMRDLEWKCKLEPRKRQGVGASRRKNYSLPIMDVVARSESPVKAAETFEDIKEIDTSYQLLTMDDLFPDYDFDEKQERRLLMDLEVDPAEEAKILAINQRLYKKWRTEHDNKKEDLDLGEGIYPR